MPQETTPRPLGWRLKRRSLLAAALAAAAVLLARLLPPDTALTARAARITTLPETGAHICWISPTRLLLVTTSVPAGPDGRGWQGLAEQIEVGSGVRTTLPGLTMALNRMAAEPLMLQANPSGNRISYGRTIPADAPAPVTVEIGGRGARQWGAGIRGPLRWLDSDHILEVDRFRNPLSVLDVAAGRRISWKSAQGSHWLSRTWEREPYNYRPAEIDVPGALRTLPIAVVRTRDVETGGNLVPMRSFQVPLPQGVYQHNITKAPGRDLLLYEIGAIHDSLPDTLLRRTGFSRRSGMRCTQRLFVSDLFGHNMREIGDVSHPVEQMDWPGLSELCWAPDGRRLYFRLDGALYVLPLP